MTRPWRALVVLLTLASPVRGSSQAAAAWDVSAGAGPDGQRVAIAAVRDLFGAGASVRVALGARATWYRGDTVVFAVRGESGCGPGGIGCVPAEARLAPAVVGLNLFGEVALRASGRVTLGANLDLAGVAAGPSRGGFRPARGTLFLYGNRDRGSLNSEFFAAVAASDRIQLRAGLSHYVVGYELVADGGGTSRYQRFFDAAFVAVRIRP